MRQWNPRDAPSSLRLRQLVTRAAGVLTVLLAVACSDVAGPERGEPTPTDPEPPTSMTVSGKLAASDGAPGFQFGRATGSSGDVAVIGAVGGHDDDDVHTGSAYVFEGSGGSWSEVAKLTASDGTAEDHFGASVAVSGDVVVVGAQDDDDGGASSGSTYVFDVASP